MVTPNNNGLAQTKPTRKKQPESENQKEIRLQRSRLMAKLRRERLRAENNAKQRQKIELLIQNNVLRQKIQNKVQELIGGPGVDDTSGIREKMNLLVSSFTSSRCTNNNATRDNGNGRSLHTVPPSPDSQLPVLPATEECNDALRQLLLYQERSMQTPQLPQGAHLHDSQQRPQRPHLNSDGPRQQQHQPQQLQLIYDQHQTLAELYSIRRQQLQQAVHSNDVEQESPCDAQRQQLSKEEQGTCHDEIALDEMQKAPDHHHQGELNGIICEEEEQLAADYRRQELRKKRQRIRQDEIALHKRHEQELQMIDYRWQQLKKEEEEVEGGGRADNAGI